MSVISKFFSTVVTPFRILSKWFTKLVPGLGKLGKLSLAAIIAWLMLLFLLIVLGAGVVRYLLADPEDVADRPWVQYFLIAFGMMLVICVATYLLVKKLQQKPVSKYEDIDEAWEFGIQALRRQQIDIPKTPLFIVHGNASAAEAHKMIRASGFKPKVEPPEHAGLALSWFANETAIFLFVTKASCLSALCAGEAGATTASAGFEMTPASNEAGRTVGDDLDAAPVAPAAPSANDTLAGSEDNVSGSHVSGSDEVPLAPATAAAGNTLTDDHDEPPAISAHPSTSQRRPLARRIDEDELNRQKARLQYVCTLLKSVRRPVCGMNGLLSLAPFDQIEINRNNVGMTLQNDLSVLQSMLAIRCPAILLITEMQAIDGFMELVKRLGPESAAQNRIGRGCETWGVPSKDRLESIGAHAAGAFEDQVFRIFKSKETLRRPYNGKLVSLMCRTRGDFSEQLRRLLGTVYGSEQKEGELPPAKQFLFSGCYFAATGECEDDESAFVGGVIAKLQSNQGKLEWSKRALQEDAVYQNWSNFFGFCGMLALIAVLLGTAGLVWKMAG